MFAGVPRACRGPGGPLVCLDSGLLSLLQYSEGRGKGNGNNRKNIQTFFYVNFAKFHMFQDYNTFSIKNIENKTGIGKYYSKTFLLWRKAKFTLHLLHHEYVICVLFDSNFAFNGLMKKLSKLTENLQHSMHDISPTVFKRISNHMIKLSSSIRLSH